MHVRRCHPCPLVSKVEYHNIMKRLTQYRLANNMNVQEYISSRFFKYFSSALLENF